MKLGPSRPAVAQQESAEATWFRPILSRAQYDHNGRLKAEQSSRYNQGRRSRAPIAQPKRPLE
jgi:hypothetical protein